MPDYFIGRQPILDRNQKLYAYELLFRSGHKNFAPGEFDGDAATAQVIVTAFTEIGLENLVGEHLAFVNAPYKFVSNPDLLPMDPGQVVLEVLEHVTIDDKTVAGIKTLAERGFTIALDDFVYSEEFEEVLPYADIVKIDISEVDSSQWQDYVKRLRQHKCKILAERVETAEEFEQLKDLGVDYFQGYFFAKPKVLSGKRVASNKLILLQMLSKLADPNTEIEVLQDLISKDVGVSVKSLNYVNSPASGLNRRVESIREAIVYLGRKTISSWVTLFVMASVDEKPQQLMTMALVRAKFCELLAHEAGLEAEDAYFTVGLFSILDSLLDISMEEALQPLSITDEMRDALLERAGHKGKALQIAVDLEMGVALGQSFESLDDFALSDIHLNALQWADAALRDMGMV